MDFLFYGVAATNGFDALGHYLRAGLIVNQCTNYATVPIAGCSANFRPVGSASAAAAAPLPVAAEAPAQQPRPAADEAEPLLDYLFGSDG
jgi:phospholipid/cholesterol/gamma-HCH transport system substrate-binding protein